MSKNCEWRERSGNTGACKFKGKDPSSLSLEQGMLRRVAGEGEVAGDQGGNAGQSHVVIDPLSSSLRIGGMSVGVVCWLKGPAA